ncbi:MAG: hypothetical protein AAB668_02725 [Patescibacteria group bacterium]
MLFQSHVEDAGVVLRVFQDRVCMTLAGVRGFPFDEPVRIGEGGFVYERDFTSCKCTLVVGLYLIDPEEGPHVDVILKSYRIVTSGERRVMVAITLRGKPVPEGGMIWPAFVDRHKTPPPPIRHLIRRFQGVGRMKDLDTDLIADERIHLLASYALHGPQSLV